MYGVWVRKEYRNYIVQRRAKVLHHQVDTKHGKIIRPVFANDHRANRLPKVVHAAPTLKQY